MAKKHSDTAHHHALQRDITMWIDGYDDLFSDFDPRPYEERSISDDFIGEMNKMAGEKNERIRTLRFQIPQEVRDSSKEKGIIDRLQTDFRRKYFSNLDIVSQVQRRGLLIAVCGLACMTASMYFNLITMPEWLLKLLRVIFEPAGWFMMWTGLDMLFFGGKEAKRRRDFYGKLEKCKVEFVPILPKVPASPAGNKT